MSTGGIEYPVFIPTKGRADCASFPNALEESGIPYILVVEPQDAGGYESAFPAASDILVLPKNDQGLTYSCQFILDFNRKNGTDWYWRVDDNVRGFFEIVSGRCIKADAIAALGYAESLTGLHPRLALIGFQYKQFAWSAKKAFVLNRRCHCCVLTRTDTGTDYRLETEMKEDIDFFLQHIQRGWWNIVINRYAMDKPTMGMNKSGGLVEAYKEGKHERAAKMIMSLWPQYCSLIEKERGLDVKFDWKAIDAHCKRVGG